MPENKKPTTSEKKSITIIGDVRDSNVFIGDNNIFKKIVNYIFPSEKETLEQRNRRILLNHVENAWIKGVLDASLHGAALLDLGIKQDPNAVTQYPWAIKKESATETLPEGLSMLEIFDSIGMGRSLLILGAPGSGKTTMLLELARGLIARAREDVTQPIPMVFNLASWTEKLTLADWLAQELNNLYSIPRKTAPDWVKGDKLLLLLDGLDEVRQESRAKCVEAINAFRKEHGLTSLAVCSRSQDYSDLNAKLSFEGAIEVQPLMQGQIAEFFHRFGDEMAGIKQALEKDCALREMAETPLFLSIMLMAYRDKQDVDILVSQDENTQRKHLFDTYIERMFERRPKNTTFKKQALLHWLSWLAQKFIKSNLSFFQIENLQFNWLQGGRWKNFSNILSALIFCLGIGIIGAILLSPAWVTGGIVGVVFGVLLWSPIKNSTQKIETADVLIWSWEKSAKTFKGIASSTLYILILVLGVVVINTLSKKIILSPLRLAGAIFSLYIFVLLVSGWKVEQLQKSAYVGQKLHLSVKNATFAFLLFIAPATFASFIISRYFDVNFSALSIVGGLIFFGFGGWAVFNHFSLRLILIYRNILPWRLIPFLDHCVDLIFLRRVGGGYIFVHRLLMEHFAEMYVETPTSKGN